MARHDSQGDPVATPNPPQETMPPPTAPPESFTGGPTPTDPAVPEPTSPAPAGRSRRAPAPRSRVGGVWAAAVLFALLLLLLLIFVLENGQRTEISFFGQHGHLPQGVALLLAAVCGILLVAIPGTARIVQLRVRDRHYRSAAAAGPPAATPEPSNDPPSNDPRT